MTKTIGAALAAVAIAATMAAPAHAAEQRTSTGAGCVSVREYRAVQDGRSKAQVEGRFDTTGTIRARTSGDLTKAYRGCTSSYRTVVVHYARNAGWHLTHKRGVLRSVGVS